MNAIDQRRAEVIAQHAGKPGLRGKVNAKCVECIYDPSSLGTWRKQTDECTARTCPLYPVRPRFLGDRNEHN